MHRPAEVGNFELVLRAEKKVLGLDIAVDHTALMAVVECLRQRCDVTRGLLFGKSLLVQQMLVNGPFARVLQDKIHTLGIMKISKETQDIGVAGAKKEVSWKQ